MAARNLQKILLVLVLSVVTLRVSSVNVSRAAYKTGRPANSADEPINQGYLYGEGAALHKGLDWSDAELGDPVYSISSGTVRQVVEHRANGCSPSNPNNMCPAWGNYVLIEHDERHFDRLSGQMGYVYSLYLHLRQFSVSVAVGNQVQRGILIAEVDDTGNSSGHHLHLQVVIHPQSNRTIEPYTLESEARSRNPEFWIEPYPSHYATALGLITDAAGTPVQNIQIFGIEKATEIGYTSSQTYITTGNEHPNGDDLYVENFATTDVKPGTYTLEARYPSGSLYKNLGSYTFLSGKDTFIDLYPVYLPYIREDSNWNSTIFIRNNSTSETARVVTTFLHNSGWFKHTRTDLINPNGSMTILAPLNFAGSAIVVGSRDIAVNVKAEACGTTCEPAGYTGVTPETGVGSVGWERAGTVSYVPLVKVNHYGRSSLIYVANVGRSSNTFTVTYYDSQGNAYTGGTYNYVPGASGTLIPNTWVGPGYYSAKIISTSGTPLAAVVLEGEGTTPFYRPAMYNAFSSSGQTLYAPKVKKNYYGHTTGFGVQNVGGAWANVTAYYYDMSGNSVGNTSFSIAPFSVYILYNPATIPDGFLGSVRLSSTNGQQIVAQENESSGSSGRRQESSLVLFGSGTTRVTLPLWYDEYSTGGSWSSGAHVRNLSVHPGTVTARWYYQNGNLAHTATASLGGSHDTHLFFGNAPNNFIGSLVLESNLNLVVVLNHRNFAGTNDTTMSINGSNR